MKATILLEWPDRKLVVKVEVEADSVEAVERITKFIQKAYNEGPFGLILGD